MGRCIRIFPTLLLAAIVGFGFVVNHGVLYRDGTAAARQLAERDPGSRSSLDPRQPGHRAVYSRDDRRCFAPTPAARYIYAGPDTPEIYALTGLRNPTRSLFDYLDPSNSARGEKLLRTLRRRGVTAIVINTRPGFSDAARAADGRRASCRVPAPRACRCVRGPLEA